MFHCLFMLLLFVFSVNAAVAFFVVAMQRFSNVQPLLVFNAVEFCINVMFSFALLKLLCFAP